MRVLVTGGTGFVGSWTTVALLAAGHDVRLLVRRPEQVPVTFEAHGVEVTDVAVGDMTDEESVRDAVRGCEAVVHAAAVFSFDPRDTATMTATNARGTEVVLGTAVRAGCDPVVHVSSTVTLTTRGETGPDLPLGDLEEYPYVASKIRAEEYARSLQARGEPVVSVYPGAVSGPHDPYLGEQAYHLAWVARGLLPLWPTGGSHYVDVRDVAAVVAAVLEPGRGPHRYGGPGHHVGAQELYGAVARAVGRRRPYLTVPESVVAATAAPAGLVNRVLPRDRRVPAEPEGAAVIACDTRLDGSAATRELGIDPVPWDTSVRDTITWLVDAGHLPERYRPG